MPLVRVEIRNEYGLGMPELYTEETKGEDPKALLQGVSVAGLVGILRQLGDLSEFAAEVFHGIQEQVLITSSRSEKLGERLYNMEAALPLLEKAILSQRSHLHFAYTSGSQWHTQLRTEQNHFIFSDLPLCIMDSYEGCHDPPPLQKLDKFDTNGRGSCFKRYSDPTYFRRASPGPCGKQLQSVQREKKAQRSKKKRSLARHRDMTRVTPTFMHDGRMDSPSRNYTGKTSPSLDGSTIHISSNPETEPKEPKMEDHLTCFDSRNESGFIECIFHPRYSTQSEENETKEQNGYLDLAHFHENNEVSDENVENSSNSQGWSFVTWDEKLEIVESTEILLYTENKLDAKESEELTTSVDLIDFDFHDDRLALSVTPNEIEGEISNYMGTLNIIASGSETDNFISEKPDTNELLSSASRLDNKSECSIIQSDTNLGTVDSNQLLSSSTRFDNKSECGIIQSDTNLGPVDSNHLLSSSICFDNKSECGIIQSDTSLGPVDSNQLLSSTTCLDNKSECSIIQSDTDSGPVDSNESLSSSTRLDSLSEQILTKKPLSTSDPHTDPIKFWTNGGLLGLAPSKPPDFGDIGPDDLMQKEDIIEDDEKVAREDDNGLNDLISASDGPIAKSFREQFGDDGGCSSSPPVEDMRRICLEAMDGCKLKLKLCNWDGSRSDSVDMFELAQDESETESDSDHTFYRSKYASSDECHSESNSEQWDSPTRSTNDG